jgi:hypothetical protein
MFLQSTRSFLRGLSAYPANTLITSHIMLHEACYNLITTGYHQAKLYLDILGSLKHALSGLAKESGVTLKAYRADNGFFFEI